MWGAKRPDDEQPFFVAGDICSLWIDWVNSCNSSLTACLINNKSSASEH
jgi:hypothetical protein